MRFQERLKEAVGKEIVRWTRPEQVHLTLKFLESVAEDGLEQLGDRLEGALGQHASFSVEAKGCGAFPSRRRPQVIWVGLDGADEPLRQLHGAVSREATPFCEETDRKRFVAHLTIGRVKGRRARIFRALGEALLDVQPEPQFGSWKVREVKLMRSHLSSAGAEHSCVRNLPLGV